MQQSSSKVSASSVEAAYNDREGVTAAFNLNLLERINRLKNVVSAVRVSEQDSR